MGGGSMGKPILSMSLQGAGLSGPAAWRAVLKMHAVLGTG